MNLDFGRCQVYKLNISACLTERELDYYNLFCDGITRKELKKRLGVDYPTSEMLSEEFHISLEDAADLLKAQMNKKCFRKFLTDEIEKFSPNEVREIRKSAIYVADEEGNLTDRIKDNKKIVWFGNECVRRCNVDLKDIPLLIIYRTDVLQCLELVETSMIIIRKRHTNFTKKGCQMCVLK